MKAFHFLKSTVPNLSLVTIAREKALGGALARPTLRSRGAISQGIRPLSFQPASQKVYGRKELDRKKKKQEKKARRSSKKAELKAALKAEKREMGSNSAAGPPGPKSPTPDVSIIPGLGDLTNLPPSQKPVSASREPSQASSTSGTPQPPQKRKKKQTQQLPQQQQQHHDQEPHYENQTYPENQAYPQQQYGQPPMQTNPAQMMQMMQMMQQMQQMQQFFQQQQGQQMPFSPQGHPSMQQGLNPYMNMTGPPPMVPNMPMAPFPMPGFPSMPMPDQGSNESKAKPAPSEESGGVPEPTAEYLDQAQNSFDTNKDPHHILLVIDLNGTLLWRPNKKRPYDFILRPHAKTFMQYCLENFFVVIWSSARPENVNKMVSQLLTPAQVKKCVLVWARDKLGLTPADYDSKVQCYKRLTSIWEDPAVKASHPDGGVWDQSNTVLVDDSEEKGRSEPYNILTLPEFEGYKNEPPNVLPQVHDYLNDLCYRSDVSAYMRQRPFGLSDTYELPE